METITFWKPGVAELGIIIVLILLIFIPRIFYLLTIQNTFKAIHPENQRMKPEHVWFMLIPLFGLVWHFVIVSRMSTSLRAEFLKRSIRTHDTQPGYQLGIVTCALACGTWIPILGMFAGIASFVCWIIYWIKISDFKKLLEQSDILDEGLDLHLN